MKEIAVHKLVVSVKEDGTLGDSILVYRIKEDGVVSSRDFKSVDVSTAIDNNALNEMVEVGKQTAEAAEGIS
jgi:hypothetical protein